MGAVSDPRYASQWHFGLIGDIETVWADHSGAGVHVGVYDDGMDQAHEELIANYDASLHYSGLGSDDGRHNGPSDGHGTAVGGLIAAAKNGLGGVGVAWGADLTVVDFLNDLQFAPEAVWRDALDWSARFDVVNLSFGRYPAFNGVADIGDPGSLSWTEAQSYALAAQTGRGGLGTVFVKAAGNEANDPELLSYGIQGNAQGAGENSLHMLIANAAVWQSGQVAGYSNHGANLLLAAPAASVTTDVTGPAGYEAGDYTSRFGGTSASTAVISGVVALMLEAEPGLGYRDVQNILAGSAAQTGSPYGGPAQGWEVAPWQGLGGQGWNGGAMSYSLSYGYGLVDAFAAVRMAEVWLAMQGAAMTGANMARAGAEAAEPQPIADFASAETVLAFAPGITVEHLHVTVDLAHERASDLTIELIAPDGSALPLFARDGGAASLDGDWTFGVAALRGMDSGGNWAVRVGDAAPGATGTLRGVGIEILGSPATADDIWTFTEDFPALAAVEPDRAFARDGDGGSDWINAAALARDTRITLGETARLSVAGSQWAQVSGGIENAASGDGDDVLTGGAGANVLLAGRGRDVLTGGTGGDVLDGGPGGDVLQGGGAGLFHTGIAAQVYRLYLAVLGRTPEIAGHQAWTGRITLDQNSLLQVARVFAASPEFQATYGNTSDTEFVTLLYRNTLGREPDPGGLLHWVGQLDGGLERSALVLKFSESLEHRGLSAAGLARFERMGDITEWADDVYRLYRAIFDRDPDRGGHDHWTGGLASGQQAFAQVVAKFMAAPEFAATYGAATSDADFVTLLYRNVMKRPPDPGGLQHWTDKLEGGAARVDVVIAFMASAEFEARTAAGLAGFMAAMGADDLLRGGAGDDVLSGGLYADRFVFVADGEASVVTVTDLEPWDVLEFHGFGQDAEALRAAFVQQGGDLVLSAAGETIVLADTQLADLGEILGLG